MAATVAAVLRLRRMVVTITTTTIRAMMIMTMYSQGVVFGFINVCWGICRVMVCLPCSAWAVRIQRSSWALLLKVVVFPSIFIWSDCASLMSALGMQMVMGAEVWVVLVLKLSV